MKSELAVTRMHKIEGKNSTLAICDLTINGEFSLNGVTLNKSKKDGSYFLGFPSKLMKYKGTKEYGDVCHPLTAEARQAATDLVVEEMAVKYGQDTLTEA